MAEDFTQKPSPNRGSARAFVDWLELDSVYWRRSDGSVGEYRTLAPREIRDALERFEKGESARGA